MEGGEGGRARPREEKARVLASLGGDSPQGTKGETKVQKSRATFQGDSFTPLLSQTDDSGPGKPLTPPDTRKDYIFS